MIQLFRLCRFVPTWLDVLCGSAVRSIRKGNMCEVLRSNFEDLFPKIEAAIIDAEFLGKKAACNTHE